MFPTQRIYLCDEDCRCTICVGRKNCTNYRTVPLVNQTSSDNCPDKDKEQELVQEILNHRNTPQAKEFAEWSPEHPEGDFAQGLQKDINIKKTSPESEVV